MKSHLSRSNARVQRAASVVALAVSGLFAGSIAGCTSPDEQGSSSESSMAAHACAGMNACKGQGGCKTASHACAGQNACKGQGGCAVPVKH